MFTTIKLISMHEDTQLYGAILPDELINEAIKDSESYKEYYAIASGAEPPKTKASVKKKQVGSDKTKTPPTAKGKSLKTSAKRLNLPRRSNLQRRINLKQISWKSSDDEDDDEVAMSGNDDDDADNQDDDDNDDDDQNDDNTDNENDDDDDDGQDHEGQDDDNERTDSDNDGDDFVHPKFSTHDEKDKEEDSFDPRVQTPSHVKSTDDKDSDVEIQGANVEGEELDEEETNEEDKANELYKDVNVSLEGRDSEMTDAPRTIIQTTHVIEDTHVIITPVNPEGQQQSSSVSSGFVSNMLNPSPDTGIDSIFNLNTESTSLVDVPVTTIAEPPLLSATILPPPPTPLITHLQQTPVPTPATVPSSSLQDLPNFGSLFGFDHRLKTLETDFSEFKQTNQFAAAVSSIPGIVDAYLANKMHEAVKTAVQLQSDKLRDEAQAENADFINKLDDNIKKIIKDQVKEQVKAQVSKILPKIEKTVNEQLEAEVLTCSSNESKTSHVVAANLSELELKKILIDKMESNKSIHRSDEQKNLYKALVDAYESDKLILDTYGDTVSFKRRRDDEDKDEEPSAGSNRGSKRRRARKEPESTSAPKEKTSKTTGKSTEGSKSHHKSADKSAQVEEAMHIAEDLEEPAYQEFVTGDTEDKPDEETSQHPDWFQKPAKPPTPDRDWNKTLPAAHRPIQPWLSTLAQKEDTSESFNELMDTPLDFSAFVMNRLKVDTLTPELLAGPTFELMKGSCKSLVELEYFFEEVYKATTDQLDQNNHEGQQYPHDLRKPLPLIPNSRGRQVIPFDHFINNDLAYLSGGVSSQKYTTSVTKTKAADYGHIKWIEDLVPNRMESARDVYSKRRIIAITKLQIIEWHNYKHLDWNTVHKDDDKLYTFKEGDFNRLRIQDIEDICFFLRVEDLQLGVESYQKKLNLTKPDTYRSDLKRREAYTAYSNPRGFIYQNKDKKNRQLINNSRQEGLRGAWRNLLVGDRTRETFGCCKGPYDLSYDVLIITGVLEYKTFKNFLVNSNKGSKSHHKSAGESAEAKEPKECTAKDLEEPAHQEFKTGVTEDQPDEETSQLPDWFQKLAKPPTPIRIDELHKFSNGTLNDVWTALDDRLKGIWIKYLPQNIWKQSDKDKAGAMIQAIDKQLKTRRIMRSLEKFIERFYTSVGNPVKEILLKLNLPDHRILKDGGEGLRRTIVPFGIPFDPKLFYKDGSCTSGVEAKVGLMDSGNGDDVKTEKDREWSWKQV
ncbi:hypothetical protein Tco_1107078 [Tanacetum coccineum]